MSIDIANEAGIDVDEVGLAAVARFTLDQMRIHPLAELSVLLVDERTMTELHERWMGEPGPTDVLAFPMDELRPPHLGGNRDDQGPEPGLLGDVVLCPQGAAERTESRLGAVAADLPRYMSVLLLLRACCEVLAAVLVTAAFVRWLGDDWRAVLSALAVVIGMRYVLTGVRPQTGRVGLRTERTAERAAAFLFPLTRAL